MKIKKSIFSILGLSLCLGALISCGSKENPAAKETTSIKTNTTTSAETNTTTSTETNTTTSTSTSTQTSTSTTTNTGPVIKTIDFGSYPQTKLDEEWDFELIEELDVKVGDLPTTDDLNNWISYKYRKSPADLPDYMFYKDIDYDDNGTNDYRAVYFNNYRSVTTSDPNNADNSIQDDHGYFVDHIYYFEYEPISWTSITEDGKTILISNLIIDSPTFIKNGSYPTGIEKNNYEYSNMREFLNDGFYNTAFNDSEKESILTTLVDNSLASTNDEENQYVCNDTEDKIFLLSAVEKSKYFKTVNSAKAKGTDYAKCQGLYVSTDEATSGYSRWFLRSPNKNMSYRMYVIQESGYTQPEMYNLFSTNIGARPALYVEFE